MKVLIADDDPVSLRVLERALRRLDYDVAVAKDGTEAWELYAADGFDLVVSDWIMPGLDGLELVRRIREAGRATYTYVVLLTSRSEKGDLLRGLEAGADDYLSKPFDSEELRARLRTAVRILQLQERLQRRNQKLQQAFEDLRSVHRRVKEDLEAAARVQQSMLPTSLPNFPAVHFAWRLEPCTELAGDILNVFPLGEHHAGFYLLDVSGHGVPAALTAVSLSRSLVPHPGQASLLLRRRTRTSEWELVSPVEVARRLNLRHTARPAEGLFFTLLYGVLDVRTRELTYVSAGHPGATILGERGDTQALAATGPPIGALRSSEYEERRVPLRAGDRLYVFSDGLTEARDANGRFFGTERLVEALQARRDESLEDALTGVVDDVLAWSGHDNLQDDASCLALEVGAQES